MPPVTSGKIDRERSTTNLSNYMVQPMNPGPNGGNGIRDEFSELVSRSWAELGSLRDELNRTLSRVIEQFPDSALIPDSTRELPRRGKQLRPLFVFLTNVMCGGNGFAAVSTAAALEFVHAASLLHDDVVDNAATRRGIPSFPSLFGDKLSILTGDFFFARALSLLAETGDHAITSAVAEATAQISIGDYSQKTLSPTDSQAETKYFHAVLNKTASLFACACQCGALRAGADRKIVDIVTELGAAFGMIYQLSDDVLDIAGSPQVLGKEPGDDLREGTPTLPVIFALKNGSEPDRQKVLSLLGAKEPDLSVFRCVLRETGALDYGLDILIKNADMLASIARQIPLSSGLKTISALSSSLVARAEQAVARN